MTPLANISNIKMGSVISALAALGLVGFCLYLIGRIYWVWYKKNVLPQRGPVIQKRKPTLFDVRELLATGQKQRATKVYRQIFRVDQKEAQAAVEALEKNLRSAD